jgi:hypothetical protein
MNEKNIEYMRGFSHGLERGREVAFEMKEDADGCVGCAFEDVESWQLPCTSCKRNCKDYWRAKKVDE